MGDLEEASCSWLQTDPAPAIMANWEVSQRVEDPSLPLTLSKNKTKKAAVGEAGIVA